MTPIDDVLISHGYKLVDDAWTEQGRRTYIHNDNATRDFITDLAKDLQNYGWVRHSDILRAFRHPLTDEIIEFEPGGADTSGHFLHHMKLPA